MRGGLGPWAELADLWPARGRKRCVLHALDQGNTVAVIEHKFVIKTADWVIDLGSDGGQGGEIVAARTPEAVAKVERCSTGGYLGGC